MRQLEGFARSCGRSLLVLDTRQGDAAEFLYQKLGYTVGGVIPGYARSATGETLTRGTPSGNRTPATSVKGSRANRYTMGARTPSLWAAWDSNPEPRD